MHCPLQQLVAEKYAWRPIPTHSIAAGPFRRASIDWHKAGAFHPKEADSIVGDGS